MQEIQENEFGERTASGVVLVEFGAEWCGPCKAMLPTLEKLSRDYAGKVGVYSVDIDHSPGIAARNGVMSVPTIMIFRDGKQVERVVGATSERELKKRLDSTLGAA